VSIVQAIPESGLFFLLGLGMFFFGILLRKLNSGYQNALETRHRPAHKQS
jgi:hypothetical protein